MKSLWLKCLLVIALALTANWAAAAFDPMAPPNTSREAGAPQDTALAWVRMNGRHSIASYGGRTVKLGDAVEGGRVSAIREDHIVISGKGGSRSIYLLDRTARSHPAH